MLKKEYKDRQTTPPSPSRPKYQKETAEVTIWMASAGQAPGRAKAWGSQQPFQQLLAVAAVP